MKLMFYLAIVPPSGGYQEFHMSFTAVTRADVTTASNK